MNKNTKRRLVKQRAALMSQHDRSTHGIVSRSEDKNMVMKVDHNVNEQGGRHSLTSFGPLDLLRPSYRRTFKAQPNSVEARV